MRPALITMLMSNAETAAGRRHLKHMPNPPATPGLDPQSLLAQIASRGIKRKLPAAIERGLEPEQISAIVRTAVTKIPNRSQIPELLAKRLAKQYDIELEKVITIMLHAIQQRNQFQVSGLVPTDVTDYYAVLIDWLLIQLWCRL